MSLSLLLLQLVIVLVVARAVGGLFRRFRQPQVVGEMLRGFFWDRRFWAGYRRVLQQRFSRPTA
jgi:hypothetical protein